jgi:outer membrane protein insertion porin family
VASCLLAFLLVALPVSPAPISSALRASTPTHTDTQTLTLKPSHSQTHAYTLSTLLHTITMATAVDADVAADATIEEMLAARLRVSGITVRGAERTRPSFLEYVVAPVVAAAARRVGDVAAALDVAARDVVDAAAAAAPETFQDVVEDVSIAVDRLRSTGCFRGVDAYIDRDPLDDAAAHVTFTVAEKSLYQIRTGTSVETGGDREASIDGSLIWRNLFGRAETLRARAGWWGGGGGHSAAFGDTPSNSLDVEFIKPFFPLRSLNLYARAGQALRNHEDWSSYSVNVRSAEIGLDTPVGRFAYQSAWRELCDVGKSASILVRDDAGHTLKSSFLHHLIIDQRDNPVLPKQGYALEFDTELAGLGNTGNVRFAKCEASAQIHAPIGASGIAIALALRSGVIATRKREDRVLICDRFHVGGANSLRGFCPRGVGPRDGTDALGGETFYTVTAMISAPTPEDSLFSQLFSARVHAFASAGDVGHSDKLSDAVQDVWKGGRRGMRDVAKQISDSSRVAVGLGIAGETALGRIEINVCNVLRSSPSDRPKTGVQFGLSQSFM